MIGTLLIQECTFNLGERKHFLIITEVILKFSNNITQSGNEIIAQPTIAYPKLTIETLEPDVKDVASSGVVFVSLPLTLNIFHTLL